MDGELSERALCPDAEDRPATPRLPSIARAEVSGWWEAHPDVNALHVQYDLEAAFAAPATARCTFVNSTPSYERNVLRWILEAPRPATLAARIATILATSLAVERVRHL